MVHRHHASILHRYGDMVPQILDARTWTLKESWNKGKESGREKGRERKKEKGKRKGQGKGKVERKGDGKGKEKRRWKEDSLRTVGRTDARTIR